MDERTIVVRPAPPGERRATGTRLDYAAALNPAQLAAVTHRQGPALVVAGAGSGKTRTLIYRVAWLIENGVAPASILLLTFTRRAAEEMLGRVERLLGSAAARAVAGGTFHSFANLVLRRNGSVLELRPNFTILDSADAADALNLLRARMGLGSKDRRFPKKGTLAEVISMARNKCRTLEEELQADFPHLIEHGAAIAALAEAYQGYKAERGLLDYDDLLWRLVELLEKHQPTRERLSERWRQIMVDEFQDTNLVQARVVRLLAAAHDNVMVVGDDAQSIYAFRGANYRNILDFPAVFPGTRVIKLEQNYRSYQSILDLANAIIARAPEKYAKTLFTTRSGPSRPLLVRAEDERMQSRFVAQRVLELREAGVALEEMAVLFRSGFHSFDLELELQRRDIPFVKRGGLKFVEAAHIKDVLAHLRVLVNPADAVSWLRALTLLPGVGSRLGAALVDRMVAQRAAPGAIAEQAALAGVKAGPSRGGLRRLGELLAGLAQSRGRPAEKLAQVLEYYRPLLRDAYPDDFPRRERDLEHLHNLAERYRSLEAMVAEMVLEPTADAVAGVAGADRDREGILTLSTIHSAKGLEWRVVFVIWLCEGRFPAAQVVDEQALEEERRLLYVAVTRARDELYLSYPVYMFQRAQGYTMSAVSRFVAELDPEVLPAAMLEESEDEAAS